MRRPRHVALRVVDAVLVIARELLLVDAAVRLAVSALEPAQPVRLANVLEPGAPLGVCELGGADEVVEHLGLVHEGEDAGDGVGLARQEGPAAADEDDAGDDADVQQDEDGQGEGDDEGADRLGPAAEVLVQHVAGVVLDEEDGVEEVLALDLRQARGEDGEALDEHRARADEEDDPVPVEEGAERDHGEGHGRVVEGERLGGRVPLREDVVRLQHADGRLETAPAELDADGQRRDGPGRPVRDDAGRREQEGGNEGEEQDDADDEGYAALLAEHDGMRVLGQMGVLVLVALAAAGEDEVLGEEGRVAQHVAPVLELVVDVLGRGRVHVLEVGHDVAHDRHRREPGDALDVGLEAGAPRRQLVEEDTAQDRDAEERAREHAREHSVHYDDLRLVRVQ